MSRVALAKVNKMYDNRYEVVKNFNLEIADKEFMVIVGPSGCGKSTTLRMIAGLEETTSGDIWIGESRVNELKPKDRDIAMVFQNYALYPHMTVYRNMAFALQLRKMSKQDIDAKIIHTAKILKIENLLNRKPKQLSGGERQRVALGRAIVRDPQVFLMDEPLSNLDAKLRLQMRAEIIKLHQKLQTTFVYVTHDQVEAMTMGSRIVVMKDGVIQQVDTPREIYSKPANLFVARFIGSPQMNIFDASVEKADHEVKLHFTEGCISLHKDKVEHLWRKLQGCQNVIVGIRPEDISLVDQSVAHISGTVEVVEHLGAENYIYINYNSNSSVVLRATADTNLQVISRVYLAFDLDKLHLFDSFTQQSLV